MHCDGIICCRVTPVSDIQEGGWGGHTFLSANAAFFGEMIASVVSRSLGRLLTSWNMMSAESLGGKIAT